MSTRPLAGSLLLALVTVIWGAAFIGQKTGMDHVGPFAFTVYRNVLAGLFLMSVVAFRRVSSGRVPALAPNLRYGFACGASLFVAMMLQQVGIMYTSSGVCAFLTANYVIAVPILGLLIGRRPGAHVWIGAVVALFGTYLICITGGESGGIGKGEALSAACAVAFGVEILVVERCVTRPDADLPLVCCSQFFTCALLGAPFLLLPSERALLGAGNVAAAAGAIAFCGILSSGVAYSMQNVGQKMLSAAPAAVIMSLECAFAALFGRVFLGETVHGRRQAGCALVFAAAFGTQLFEVLASTSRRRGA